MRRQAACLLLLATAVFADSAAAHPHILIEARAAIVFDAAGRATGVNHTWTFDDAFSAFAVQGYDSKGDGRPSRAELQPLADINIKSLTPYQFFTSAKIDGLVTSFDRPERWWDEFVDEALVLHFTLPFAKPLDISGRDLELDVFDPEYFAAMAFAADQPVTTPGGRACAISIHRPEALDPSLAATLAVVPADQRTLPPDLLAVTSKLVNGADIRCR